MDTAVRRRHHRAAQQLGNAAGRLDSLSPLAVLGRGYAVAWNAGRTRVLRDASSVAPGDTIHVTLSKGEVDCEVVSTADPTHKTPRTQS
jgi:exodeoxyribonuclease VII large subunit